MANSAALMDEQRSGLSPVLPGTKRRRQPYHGPPSLPARSLLLRYLLSFSRWGQGSGCLLFRHG